MGLLRRAGYRSASQVGERWRTAMRLLDLRTRFSLTLLIVGRFAVGVCDLLVAAATYLLFLRLQGHGVAPRFWGETQTILSLSAITAILVVLRALMDGSTALLALRQIHKLQTNLLLRLVRGYSEIQWSRLAERNRSELVNSTIHTTRDAADFYHRWIELVASGLIVTVMTVAIVHKSPVAACGFVVALAGIYVLHRFGIRSQLQAAAANREASIRMLQRDLADMFSSWKEIRAYHLQRFFGDRIRSHAQRMAAGSTRSLFLPQIGRGVADQGTVLLFLLLIVAVQLRQGDAHQLLALFAFYFVLSRRLLPLVSQMSFIAGQMESSWEHVRIVDEQLNWCQQHRAADYPAWPPRTGYALELTRVSFSFNQEAAILRDLNLFLREGEIIVLQGPSGVGKTTLLNLIAGISQPQSGTVRVDRTAICYVPQEVPLLDDSIRSNLLFGLTGRSDAELMQALTLARIEQLVTAQPYGLEVNVGDNGALLSGGQRQRLGLARALLRGGNLLLLDEATSALDEDSEREILAMLAASGKAVLLVTHRARAAVFAHRVLRLENGGLLEEFATVTDRIR